jgi:hypothetical protein
VAITPSAVSVPPRTNHRSAEAPKRRSTPSAGCSGTARSRCGPCVDRETASSAQSQPAPQWTNPTRPPIRSDRGADAHDGSGAVTAMGVRGSICSRSASPAPGVIGLRIRWASLRTARVTPDEWTGAHITVSVRES